MDPIPTAAGITLLGPISPAAVPLFTLEAQEFLGRLARKFNYRRLELLAQRQGAQILLLLRFISPLYNRNFGKRILYADH